MDPFSLGSGVTGIFEMRGLWGVGGGVRVSDFGLRISGFGFRVSDFGRRDTLDEQLGDVFPRQGWLHHLITPDINENYYTNAVILLVKIMCSKFHCPVFI